MTPLRGRSPRGERCLGSAPHGHWKTTTFVAALRHDALTAPMVTDGPINGALFLGWVRTFLCPKHSCAYCNKGNRDAATRAGVTAEQLARIMNE